MATGPQNILEIKCTNPLPPADPNWAESNGKKFPTDVGLEWIQVLDPDNEYDEFSLIGASGWVIHKEESRGDVPFDHPFGFDWEFQVALDDPYNSLLSAANGNSETDYLAARQEAVNLGLAVPPNGLLGVEWDKGVLPQSFRDGVNEGDRVAVFGRWILDRGHDFSGNYRTEIHPPLLVATASVQQDDPDHPSTRVMFMSRPYLPGQRFCVDAANAYRDDADDDGCFWDHILNECKKIQLFESTRVEAHPHIKSFPFKGVQVLHIIVRPPQPPRRTVGGLHIGGLLGDLRTSVLGGVRTGEPVQRLVASFNFTVRSGCAVEVTSLAADTVDIIIALNSAGYTPPPLPPRRTHDYSRDELDQYSRGSGLQILEMQALNIALADLLTPLNALRVGAAVGQGVRGDVYENLSDVNIFDQHNAVLNEFVSGAFAPGRGVTVNDSQPYPVYGWIEVKQVQTRLVAEGGYQV